MPDAALIIRGLFGNVILKDVVAARDGNGDIGKSAEKVCRSRCAAAFLTVDSAAGNVGDICVLDRI